MVVVVVVVVVVAAVAAAVVAVASRNQEVTGSGKFEVGGRKSNSDEAAGFPCWTTRFEGKALHIFRYLVAVWAVEQQKQHSRRSRPMPAAKPGGEVLEGMIQKHQCKIVMTTRSGGHSGTWCCNDAHYYRKDPDASLFQLLLLDCIPASGEDGETLEVDGALC